MTLDRHYLERRLQKERDRVANADNPASRQAHSELAEEYERQLRAASNSRYQSDIK